MPFKKYLAHKKKQQQQQQQQQNKKQNKKNKVYCVSTEQLSIRNKLGDHAYYATVHNQCLSALIKYCFYLNPHSSHLSSLLSLSCIDLCI